MPASRKPIDEALAMAGVVRGPKPVARPNVELVAPTGENRSGADTDERLIELWLARYDSPHTRRCYDKDTQQFLEFVEAMHTKPTGLRDVTVAHIVAYLSYLREETEPPTQARKMSSLKSLLSFGHNTGYLHFNVGAAIKSPKFHDHLAERILTVEQVRAMIGAARPVRDRALVKFLYFSGARISEACGLEWKHVREVEGLMRVSLHGKGKKTRHVPLPALLAPDFAALGQLRLGPFVFESCYGNRLNPKDAWRIVRRAARDAYIRLDVSPHWLRHAHATHALRRGAPINVVRETLGHTTLQTTGRYTHMETTESSGLFLAL